MERNDRTTFICLFHSADHAESALNALESAGIQRNTITSTWNGSTDREVDRNVAGVAEDLTRIGVPERDLEHMREGVSKGGVVLSLEAPENRSDEIERIFHRYSANKFDEADLHPYVPESEAPANVKVTAPSMVDTAVVPVVEEELVVGKRQVDRGGVRVFRRTVTEPVSADMSLHEEHVVMERRPVDRPVSQADLSLGEQTIELTETEEVPVISKVSRVVEEVRVGVVGSERTERIEDTVRHTEVDVEQVDAPSDTRRSY